MPTTIPIRQKCPHELIMLSMDYCAITFVYIRIDYPRINLAGRLATKYSHSAAANTYLCKFQRASNSTRSTCSQRDKQNLISIYNVMQGNES